MAQQLTPEEIAAYNRSVRGYNKVVDGQQAKDDKIEQNSVMDPKKIKESRGADTATAPAAGEKKSGPSDKSGRNSTSRGVAFKGVKDDGSTIGFFRAMPDRFREANSAGANRTQTFLHAFGQPGKITSKAIESHFGHSSPFDDSAGIGDKATWDNRLPRFERTTSQIQGKSGTTTRAEGKVPSPRKPDETKPDETKPDETSPKKPGDGLQTAIQDFGIKGGLRSPINGYPDFGIKGGLRSPINGYPDLGVRGGPRAPITGETRALEEQKAPLPQKEKLEHAPQNFGIEGGLRSPVNGYPNLGVRGGPRSPITGETRALAEQRDPLPQAKLEHAPQNFGIEGGLRSPINGYPNFGIEGGLRSPINGYPNLGIEGGLRSPINGYPNLGIEGGLRSPINGYSNFGIEGGLRSPVNGYPDLGVRGGMRSPVSERRASTAIGSAPERKFAQLESGPTPRRTSERVNGAIPMGATPPVSLLDHLSGQLNTSARSNLLGFTHPAGLVDTYSSERPTTAFTSPEAQLEHSRQKTAARNPHEFPEMFRPGTTRSAGTGSTTQESIWDISEKSVSRDRLEDTQPISRVEHFRQQIGDVASDMRQPGRSDERRERRSGRVRPPRPGLTIGRRRR